MVPQMLSIVEVITFSVGRKAPTIYTIPSQMRQILLSVSLEPSDLHSHVTSEFQSSRYTDLQMSCYKDLDVQVLRFSNVQMSRYTAVLVPKCPVDQVSRPDLLSHDNDGWYALLKTMVGRNNGR